MGKYSKVVPTVTAASTVRELIEFVRYAFQDEPFEKVEAILTNRENEFKTELERLRKNRDILKEERDLFEKKHGLAELEKLMLEDELRKSRREHDELNEKLLNLNEENKLLSDREKKSEKWSEKLARHLLEAEKENDRIVVEFNEKFEALKREMHELLESEKSRIILEFTETIKVLEQEKCEMGGKTEVYKEDFYELNEKVMKLEEVIAGYKGVDDHVTSIKEEANVAEEKQTCFTASRGGEERIANEISCNRANVKLDYEILDSSHKKGPHPTDLARDNGLPNGERLTSEAGGSNKPIHPSKETTGRLVSATIIIDLSASDDDVPTGGTTCVSKIGEISVNEKGMASVKSENNESSSLEKEKFESDCGESYLKSICPKRGRSSSENEDYDNIPIGELKRKRIHEFCDDRKSSLPVDCLRKPVSVAPDVAESVSPSKSNSGFIKRCEENARTEQNPQLPLEKPILDTSACFKDVLRDDFWHMMSADLLSGRESTWKYAADMLSAFKKDPELCMNAVCALYRLQISAHKSTKGFSTFKGRGFSSLDALKGTAAAKYLINNDPENKLSRSVSEVRAERPKMLEDCERLATQYCEQLFDIYQKKLDPFFRPKYYTGCHYVRFEARPTYFCVHVARPSG